MGVALQAGCGDTLNTYNSYHYGSEAGQAGEATSAAGQSNGGSAGAAGAAGAAGQGGEAGDGPDDGHLAYPDAPYADTTVAEHGIDVFGVVGNRYWLGVSDEQLAEMNEGVNGGGGPIFDGPLNGDIYTPGGQTANFVDHLWITSAGPDGGIADYGKVQVKLAGQSTLRAWSKRSIPNFNVDSNEFVDKQRIGGFEHLRFNNGQVGSIFREYLTLELYRKLDYPAPLVTYAWVSSNVWGGEISIPYILVERYKRSFCARGDAFGGKCENMWEFAGDIGQKPDGNPGPLPPKPGGGNAPSVFDDPNNCQFSKCDNTRAKELEQLLSETPAGEGFKAATEELLDWPAFHRFQCLSWILATGDDALHNSNNVVLAERADGKFQFLPYSVDISLGQDWYQSVSLPGTSNIARGCQADKACWADTIAMCDDVLAAFVKAKPIAMLDATHDLLDAEGMLRDGDEARYELLRAWFEERLISLPEELDANREGPVLCTGGLVDCGGYCVLPEQCGVVCKPPVGKAAPAPDGAGGAPSDEGPPNECPMITAYPL